MSTTIIPSANGHKIYLDGVYAGRIDSRISGYGSSRIVTWDCENELEFSLGWGASVADAVGIVEGDFVRRADAQSKLDERMAELENRLEAK